MTKALTRRMLTGGGRCFDAGDDDYGDNEDDGSSGGKLP